MKRMKKNCVDSTYAMAMVSILNLLGKTSFSRKDCGGGPVEFDLKQIKIHQKRIQLKLCRLTGENVNNQNELQRGGSERKRLL